MKLLALAFLLLTTSLVEYSNGQDFKELCEKMYPSSPKQGLLNPTQLNPTQGEYSTLSLSELGTKITQENIKDTKHNLMIAIVPAHNGRVATKTVFDGDSDLMMIVKPSAKTCTISKSFLPRNNVARSFAKSRENSMDQVGKRQGSIPAEIKLIKMDFEIKLGIPIPQDSLPEKFQPHCPPGFMALTAHTVDTSKKEEADQYNKTVETMADLFDYKIPQPPTLLFNRQNRQITHCRVFDKITGQINEVSSCHPVTIECDDQIGCAANAFKSVCTRGGEGNRGCVYLLTDCLSEHGTTPYQCIIHLQETDLCCKYCCHTATKCERDQLPICNDMTQESVNEKCGVGN